MKLKDWFLKFYFPIVDEFKYSISDDAESARVLEEVGKLYSLDVLEKFKKKTAFVIGNGPKCPNLISKTESKGVESTVITAGKAILRYSGKIDIHVTDLDEGYDAVCKAADEAIIVVVHAHGDNIEMVKECVPSLGKIVGTTQYIPFGRVYNFGGFTDGDRAAILAKALTDEVKLVNFDFSRAESEVKLRKLKWAKKILEFEELLY